MDNFWLYLLLLIPGVLVVWFIRAKMIKRNFRERLFFGIQLLEEDEPPEISLSSGDYGLEGVDRVIFFLTKFLSTPIGYIVLFALGALIGFLLKLIFGFEKFNTLLLAALIGVLLFSMVNIFINRSKRKRSQRIRYELPNALQSIVAVMESGLAFESALQHVVRESGVSHPLYFDLQVMMDAMQQGRRRNDALKLWATRANERTVTDVVAAMIQADQTGAALGSVLRHHATSQLKEIEAELLKKAERIPIYMIFPMMFCILPPIMIVAVGPSAIRIVRMFQAIMSKA